MKAVVPAGLGKVEEADVDEVEPAAGELAIEVAAFSINRGETFQLDNPPPDWRPGKDVAGQVVRAAPDGTGPAVGARVVAHLPHSGWAERVVARTDQVAVLPAAVTLEQAAALPLAGLTALRMLRTAGSVIGRRILLTGASGGVGHYFTELAAASGASVTAVVSSPPAARDCSNSAPKPSCTTWRTRAGRSTWRWSLSAARACRSRSPRSVRAAN